MFHLLNDNLFAGVKKEKEKKKKINLVVWNSLR